ncbi:MAG TPA: hypothetical protein VGR15_00135, partial [Bacteroidota bacterium]|nr:hypothetical protein [Bacteroidota bacterium]
FFEFVRHQFDLGKGSYLFYTIHRKAGRTPPSIPISVYAGLLIYPFSARGFGRAVVLFILIICAQIAVAMGFFAAALSSQHAQDAR